MADELNQNRAVSISLPLASVRFHLPMSALAPSNVFSSFRHTWDLRPLLIAMLSVHKKKSSALMGQRIYSEWEYSKIIQLQSLLLPPESEEPLLQEPLQLS